MATGKKRREARDNQNRKKAPHMSQADANILYFRFRIRRGSGHQGRQCGGETPRSEAYIRRACSFCTGTMHRTRDDGQAEIPRGRLVHSGGRNAGVAKVPRKGSARRLPMSIGFDRGILLPAASDPVVTESDMYFASMRNTFVRALVAKLRGNQISSLV